MITEKRGCHSNCPVRGLIHRVRHSEAARHMRNARKEVLLAVKSVVEAGIERLEATDKEVHEGPARKVDIG